MSKVSVYVDGVGCLFPAMFVLFVILKLTETIDWSWWWVTCPLWILPLTVATTLVVAVLFMLATAITIGAFLLFVFAIGLVLKLFK